MRAAVRYYSRSGNTKLVAEAMADSLNVTAISVDEAVAAITENTDVLFVGGALYAYGIDRNLKGFLENLPAERIGKAVVFSTSWISRHGLDVIRQMLERKRIPVEEKSFYVKNRATEQQLADAAKFARTIVED